ncbi:hypothetical protein RFI_04325, partial [Reticulomyxa filosa]
WQNAKNFFQKKKAYSPQDETNKENSSFESTEEKKDNVVSVNPQKAANQSFASHHMLLNDTKLNATKSRLTFLKSPSSLRNKKKASGIFEKEIGMCNNIFQTCTLSLIFFWPRQQTHEYLKIFEFHMYQKIEVPQQSSPETSLQSSNSEDTSKADTDKQNEERKDDLGNNKDKGLETTSIIESSSSNENDASKFVNDWTTKTNEASTDLKPNAHNAAAHLSNQNAENNLKRKASEETEHIESNVSYMTRPASNVDKPLDNLDQDKDDSSSNSDKNKNANWVPSDNENLQANERLNSNFLSEICGGIVKLKFKEKMLALVERDNELTMEECQLEGQVLEVLYLSFRVSVYTKMGPLFVSHNSKK